jgi:thermitase
LLAVLTATFIGYIVIQSLFQEAETQTRDESSQRTEEPTYVEGSQRQAAPDRIIVKLEENATRSDLEEVNDQNNASTEKDLPRSQVNVVDLPRDLSVGEAVENYEASPNVEYAEPDFVLRPSQTRSANDSYYPRLYGLNNSGQNGGAQGADVDAPEAWNSTIGDSNTVVAVIDEGVDINHPDLRNNIWTNPGETARDGIDNDRNGYVDDVNGWDFYNNDASVYDPDSATGAGDDHGTHVAGTIAAEGNNSAGVVGVNWQAKIMPLKFLGPTGGYTSDAVEALNYAVNKGVKVSNNSWGGGGSSQALLDAINRADAAGHLFVAAAGNGGADGVGDNNDTTPHYPSSYNSANIISVAATNSQDSFASFSNYGANSVDVTAPGVGILSTLPGETYGSYSGTSMATPHVTGIAALLKSQSPELDDAQLRNRILQYVEQKANFQGKVATNGRVNAYQALTSKADTPPPPPSPTPYTAPPYSPPPSYGGGGDGGSKAKKGKGNKGKGKKKRGR